MISFIIPAYNEEKAIAKTLESVARYRGAREIIVSDDNSRDATVAIARQYTERVLINQSGKRGISANRNRGAKAAQGDYLVFLDSDVVIGDPDAFFEKALAIFRANPRIVALSGFIKVEKSLETVSDRLVWAFFNYLYAVLNNVIHAGAAAGKFQMIRADAFRKVNGYDENLVTGEDTELFRRLSKIGRTRFERSLVLYHSGRREHAIGWPKLLWLWTRDTASAMLFGKSASAVWKDIR